MKPVRIFRHITCEGPGYLAEVLQHYNIPFELVRIDQGDTLPDNNTGASALVFMGGPMSVNDDLPWITQELALIRQAVRDDLPVLGHCLGGQLISKALGGVITANPVKEIGWLPVQKLTNPATDNWLGNIPDESLMFHWHGETFSIPQGATAILKSRHCDHQGFVIGNTLALQCHIEMTAEMVREWSGLYEAELLEPGETIQSRNTMLLNLEENITRLQANADAIYRRWLQPLLATAN